MSPGGRPKALRSGHARGNHFSCSMSAVLLARVREHGGDAAVAELLRVARIRRTAAHLSDIANWISFDEAQALWRAGAKVTHHPQFARAVGEDAVRFLQGSPVATLLRSLGSPEAVFSEIATTATKYSTASTLQCVTCGPGYAELTSTAAPGFPRSVDHCAWTCGLLSQPTILFGLPPATVHHERCAAHGALVCEYRVTWPVSATRRGAESEQIAALHGQLDAMKVRLNSMFSTASDLIDSGDIDDVLERIAERAAMEVRAPRHLLAVRMEPGGPLHCHHTGFDPDEVHEHAERLLSHELHVPESWLAVPVRSNRREYGRLLATCPDGARFFRQERELLEVYARYAASALDSAAALREVERRNAQSSALLDLARALAAAGTSTEIARRLADAVPTVVDCDRVGVYLWDTEHRLLRRLALAPAEGVDGIITSETTTWTPRRGGALERFLADPNQEPMLLTKHSGQLGKMFTDIGCAATILVPIASPGQLLGLLSVSVGDRPERLHLSADLLDRVSGVAASATTALQNGRLVDVITHQALHDQLTGLANRLQFTTQLRDAVERAHTTSECGALFYVDLDRFKPVNDEFGHETGDALLVAVAERLRRCTRESDVVARLGGDEFAVLLVGAGDREIERVSRRILDAFEQPFVIHNHRLGLGVSIGCTQYPFEAEDADGLLRRADAAMFADKREHQAARLALEQAATAA